VTKGLQEQYKRDFPKLVDIRGKENYECAGKPPNRCKYGPHEGCNLAGDLGCVYESARWEAKNAQAIITNYSYWVRANKFGPQGLCLMQPESIEPVNPFELLICDEGHHAMEALAGALRVSVNERQLRAVGAEGWSRMEKESTEDVEPWVKWARGAEMVVKGELAKFTDKLKKERGGSTPAQLMMIRERVRDLDQLSAAVESIQNMKEKDWVVEQRMGTALGRVWDFDCVWPAQWAESSLWCGVPNVVVMSATLKPMSLNLLGIKTEKRAFKEWPRVFPGKNTPVVHVPTVRLNRHVKEEGLEKWVERIDEIVESRAIVGNRKGLVHTVSYARQQFYLENSRHRGSGLFLANNSSDPESGTARDVYEKFKDIKGGETGSVLVSPSFSTGWDFPDDQCRWQVIGKVPFPDGRGKVMKARMARDDRYLSYMAMQDLVQACGRGTRNEKDWCEVFIVDDTIGWFLYQNKTLAPGWFEVRKLSGVPKLFRG
jgi:Rad3-related DNA helicase